MPTEERPILLFQLANTERWMAPSHFPFSPLKAVRGLMSLLLPCQVITLGCIICGQQRQSAHQPRSLARREFPVYFSLTDPRTLVRRRRVWPAFFATYLSRFVETRRRSTTTNEREIKVMSAGAVAAVSAAAAGGQSRSIS